MRKIVRVGVLTLLTSLFAAIGVSEPCEVWELCSSDPSYCKTISSSLPACYTCCRDIFGDYTEPAAICRSECRGAGFPVQ